MFRTNKFITRRLFLYTRHTCPVVSCLQLDTTQMQREILYAACAGITWWWSAVICSKRVENKFDDHRTVHPNIISVVKPTRWISVSNLFYFGMTLYMFRTVFPSIIRSSRLYIQQQAYVKQIPLSNCSSISFPLASRQQYLFDICLFLYVQSSTADDGRKDRPKHVECRSKIK